VVPPGAETLVSTPRSVQAALRALSGSRFFAGLALRAMVFDLKQVHRHLTDPDLRVKALARVADQIGEDTQVVVAHSLGSAITYEALRTRPGHEVRALVTIGSPLGIPNLIPRSLRTPPCWRRPAGMKFSWLAKRQTVGVSSSKRAAGSVLVRARSRTGNAADTHRTDTADLGRAAGRAPPGGDRDSRPSPYDGNENRA
jgi:pimeloyl-ACP methyl ester carboxylesterase